MLNSSVPATPPGGFCYRELCYFLGAVRFFTRLPVPAWVGHSADMLNHSARYFPAVGLVVGGIGGAAWWAAGVAFPPLVAVLLSLAVTLLVTGAFHEDGFADACDGLGGGWDKAQILTIMKDSRIGSYGTLGIGVLVALKVAALAALAGVLPAAACVLLLVAGHAVSRLASTALIATLDYVREDAAAKSRPLAQRLRPGEALVAGLFGLLPVAAVALAAGWPALAAALPAALPALLPACLLGVALAAAVAVLCAVYFRQRLGGYTGDLLGATQQLSEVAFYLGALCISG